MRLSIKTSPKKILYAFFKIVYPQLGYGFLEKVNENAMLIALHNLGVTVRSQAPIAVYFQEQVVGEYFAELLVEDAVLVDLKAVHHRTNEHEAQLLNYFRATPYEVGLLLNDGVKPQFARKVFDNTKKTITWKSTEKK